MSSCILLQNGSPCVGQELRSSHSANPAPFIPPITRVSSISLTSITQRATPRDVSVSAGKKKRVSPGGRFDGPRKPKDLGPSPEVIDKVLAEADIVYNDDYYKYGAYGPYRHRGMIFGEPKFGSVHDKDMVFLYSSVRDDEEMEEMHKFQQCRIFDKKLDMMDSAKMHFFYVFVRGTSKPRRWQPPWKTWTLAAHVVVESGDAKLDKWDVGERVDLRARHGVTRCVSWCRPDLIWVKRPEYQMRYEPQEDYMRGLFELLNPETELDGIEGEDVEERRKKSFYYRLCERLGVEVSASEAEIVAAWVGLDEERRSLVLEHMMNGQPVQFLHPFTKEWRRKEAEAEATGRKVEFASDESVWDDEDEEEGKDEDGEQDHGSEDGDENEEDEDGGDDEDEEGGDDEEEEDGRDDEDDDIASEEAGDQELDLGEALAQLRKYDEEQLESFESQEEEEEPGGDHRILEEGSGIAAKQGNEEEVGMRKKRKRRMKESYFGGKPHPLRKRNLTSWQRDFYREVTPSYAALRRYPRELYFHHFDQLDDDRDESKNWNFEPGTGLKAAVRPFTYQDMLEEIVYIRRQFTCYN
ncbi:hypothetical protein SELMODRAFT_405613 [Selaginella moellendorffii]|uniref:Uncharacterized protein n=1 Tax=Selaginella moellendorffii TaxID=88036 RepID=D8QZ52_SELML|nr:uncharacterized protein LOC9655613 [Selaginella moellendorffii]EFJ34729.1 hypothetical protein SELMODRAFT_405613 [Selaginella moellendorffii]|eukprot:XP_002964396.1 uncharacterized protein LOC9655613 [Selaginella moellendorffii]